MHPCLPFDCLLGRGGSPLPALNITLSTGRRRGQYRATTIYIPDVHIRIPPTGPAGLAADAQNSNAHTVGSGVTSIYAAANPPLFQRADARKDVRWIDQWGAARAGSSGCNRHRTGYIKATAGTVNTADTFGRNYASSLWDRPGDIKTGLTGWEATSRCRWIACAFRRTSL